MIEGPYGPRTMTPTTPDPDWLRPDWHREGVQALMTTRRGGVSTGAFDSMNVRDGLGDDASAVCCCISSFTRAPYPRRARLSWPLSC